MCAACLMFLSATPALSATLDQADATANAGIKRLQRLGELFPGRLDAGTGLDDPRLWGDVSLQFDALCDAVLPLDDPRVWLHAPHASCRSGAVRGAVAAIDRLSVAVDERDFDALLRGWLYRWRAVRASYLRAPVDRGTAVERAQIATPLGWLREHPDVAFLAADEIDAPVRLADPLTGARALIIDLRETNGRDSTIVVHHLGSLVAGFGGELVLLVSGTLHGELEQWAIEAMALPRSFAVGEATRGRAGPVQRQALGDGWTVDVPGFDTTDVLQPWVAARGFSIDDIRAGRDDALEAAIDALDTQNSRQPLELRRPVR